MTTACVYLIGESLIADTIADFLIDSRLFARMTRFENLIVALNWIINEPPNLLFIVDLQSAFLIGNTPFLPMFSDIPVICLDVKLNSIKVVTTTELEADSNALLRKVRDLVSPHKDEKKPLDFQEKFSNRFDY